MSSSEAAVLQSPPKRYNPTVVTLSVIVWFVYMIPLGGVAFICMLGSVFVPIAVPFLLYTSGIHLKYVFSSVALLLVLGMVGGIRAGEVRVRSGRGDLSLLYGIRAVNPLTIYGWHGPYQIFSCLRFLKEIGRETMESQGSS